MEKLNLQKAYGWRQAYEPAAMRGEAVDKSRLTFFKLVMAASVVVLLARLFFLQVVRGEELRLASVSNRTYVKRVLAPRGVIKSREGKVLVVNEPVYEVLLDNQGRVVRDRKQIPKKIALELKLAGDEVAEESVGRYYVEGGVMAHVLGFVGEVNEADLDKGELKPGDIIGKQGIEKTLDAALRGQVGEEVIELDAQGKVLRWVDQVEPVAGADVGLTIDLRLQKKLDELLGGKVGVAVASRPQTGEVLALVSKPSFDPNVFSRRQGAEDMAEARMQVLEDESMPMLNRAISGTYPPASVYKVVPALAALELGEIEAETLVADTGELRVNEYTYGNWYYSQYGRTEGEIGVVAALARSNDIFFYKLGEWVGPDRLANWSEKFGLGRVTGIELTGEVAGLVPNTLWKEREKGEGWFLGNTYHMAIGQGDLLVTPLQLHQMMGVVANGGRWCQPKLVAQMNGEPVLEVACEEVGLGEANLELVRQGLMAACEQGGTAYPFFDFDLAEYGAEYSGEGRNRVGCKTGTAQFFDSEDRTHAWFSVYAPAVNPEIMMTVLVEGGGEGSAVAAPIAREALEYWFGEVE